MYFKTLPEVFLFTYADTTTIKSIGGTCNPASFQDDLGSDFATAIHGLSK